MQVLDASGLEPLEAAEAGSSTLELAVETNSQLKAALRSVSMTMVAPPALAIDETSIEPEGSSYDAASRKIKWTVAPELRRNQPVTCRVGSAAAPETALSAGALRGVWNAAPVKMEFQSEGVTISGIEVEIQASITDTPPIAKLLRRFAAGDYQVANTVPEPAAPAASAVAGALAASAEPAATAAEPAPAPGAAVEAAPAELASEDA